MCIPGELQNFLLPKSTFRFIGDDSVANGKKKSVNEVICVHILNVDPAHGCIDLQHFKCNYTDRKIL